MPQNSSGTAANHPKVKYLRQYIDNSIKLSVEKAAAHLKNPGQFPLPAGNDSLEFALVDFFKAIPKRKRDDFLDTMKDALNAGAAARQQKYGPLAAIDLYSKTAVADQVKSIPLPANMILTDADIATFTPKKKTPTAAKPLAKAKQVRQVAPGTILRFAVENITCNETSDIRKDELSISAFVTSSSGEQQESNNFFSADFKEGESKSPGAAGNLFSFSLDDSTGTAFPASFAAGVFVIEKDWFRNPEAIQKLSNVLRIAGKIIATAVIAIAFIPGVGLPLAFTILGIGAVIMFTGDFLPFASDDFSDVVSDELLLETAPFAGETFARNINIGFLQGGFRKKGSYTVAVRWSVA